MSSCANEPFFQEAFIGARLKVQFMSNGAPVNLSEPSVKKIILVRPDGSKITKDASLLNDGTDGIVYYDTEDATILVPAGPWNIQGYGEKGNVKGYTSVGSFTVKKNK